MSLGTISQETLAAVRDAMAGGPQRLDDTLRKDATTTGITASTGLYGYNLEAPSKKLFPAPSLLRNRFPRVRGYGNSVQWKAITAINAGKLKAGVADGSRNSNIQFTEVDKTQSYKEFGLDSYVTFGAADRAQNFEDVRAAGVTNTMTAVMIEEEKLLLGGNVTAIGKPSATGFTAVDSSNSGPFTATTAYDFGVSALTLYGYINAATGRAGGVDATDETDARTLTTFTTGGGKTSVTLTWAAVRGAVGYNVFIGAHSGTLYYAFTTTQTSITIDSTVLAALPGSGNTPNLADQTADALSFDGVIPQLCVSGSGAYWKDLAGGTLTGDNAGGISEWDTALKDIYDRTRTGPTLILVSSQEAKNSVTKIAANGSTTVLRITEQVGAGGMVQGGLILDSYLNRYTQEIVPIKTHPFLPAGTVVMITERLPYPNSNVPNVFEVDTLREYTQYEWAQVARKYEFGVYGAECLKVFFPSGCAVLTGIKNG